MVRRNKTYYGYGLDLVQGQGLKKFSLTLGVEKVNCDLETQLVAVNGSGMFYLSPLSTDKQTDSCRVSPAAPSQLISAIKSTERDPILRGSGAPNSAAVCILETHCPDIADPVRGLARIVQVSPQVLIIDLTVRGLSPGTYSATIRECGDISKGAESTGGVWESGDSSSRGFLSTFEVDSAGAGGVFLDKNIAVWELIGRSIVVSREHGTPGPTDQEFWGNAVDTVVGVIARSAGVWENAKTVCPLNPELFFDRLHPTTQVCSCSGKTMWDERKDSLQRGMI